MTAASRSDAAARGRRTSPGPRPVTHADAIVVGAGPGGSAAAYFLARAGHDVVLLEKEAFPRDKVCGDGLTPRAVRALQSLGLHAEAAGEVRGWARQDALRMYGGDVVLDLPWPDLPDWPSHSVTATRSLFDATLARNAEKAGAQVWERCDVTGPVWLSPSQRRVAGVAYRRADGATGHVRAPLVIAADGGSSRLAVALGLHRNPKRPMSVALRAYYRSPRSASGVMEGFLEMRTKPAAPGAAGELLPGYGWIFPLADGLVNVGWGLLSSSGHFRTTNYRRVLSDWVASFPPEWDITPETMVGTPRSAGLPMGHNRKPCVHKGVLLVGDAAGMVNAFNGEGISYAIEAGELAAQAADAALRTRSDAPLAAYERAVADAWGGYYRLGSIFAALMGNPAVMRFCVTYGMPRRALMEFVFRTMAHLVDRPSADATDRILSALERAVPAA